MTIAPAPAEVWIEKIEGRGEDARALLAAAPGRCALGVFDGLGGSGGRALKLAGGREISAARYAADLARQVAVQALQDCGFEHDDAWAGPGAVRAALEKQLKLNFAEQAGVVDRDSALRGSLTRRLPTTMCVVLAETGAPLGTTLSALWAGDSRAYVWTHDHGLAQLTRDHAHESLDALASLSADAPMSNFVSPDIDYFVELHTVSIDEPCLFFAATDGAFQSSASPMEFELALVEALAAAPDWHAALRRFGEAIQGAAQDDAAIAIAGAHGGWPDVHAAARAAYEARLKPELAALGEGDGARAALWARYQAQYERFAPPAPSALQKREAR
ncbi:MAG: hypothetical protein GC206_13750 [Alphaproteobacteria bacterium]|nr:hypothetical protein [Alphaproteobacteria bacterium]